MKKRRPTVEEKQLRAENEGLRKAFLAERAVVEELMERVARAQKPIPMIIHCPECKRRHVDQGEWATREHHTHSCQHCGLTWRPAVVATVGVQFLPGFKDP